jgi:hypothetical protein
MALSSKVRASATPAARASASGAMRRNKAKRSLRATRRAAWSVLTGVFGGPSTFQS